MKIQQNMQILQVLYDEWVRGSRTLDRNRLVRLTSSQWDSMQRNLDYLEEKKYIEVKRINVGIRIFEELRITAKGIDLIATQNNIFPKTINILFLAADPKDTPRLRLGEEARRIDAALRQAKYGDKFDIEQHWAVRVSDLQDSFLRHKPHIVHFSGHGSTSSQIILEDSSGNSHPVSPRALSQVFSVLKDNIRCVVLNACYSEQQAQSIAQHVDWVVGMSKAIKDEAAISFAAAFYRALAYGKTVKIAFDSGCVEIDLENLDEQDTPKLLTSKSNPEDIAFITDDL